MFGEKPKVLLYPLRRRYRRRAKTLTFCNISVIAEDIYLKLGVCVSSKGGHHGTAPNRPIMPSSGQIRPILPFWKGNMGRFWWRGGSNFGLQKGNMGRNRPILPSRRAIWDAFGGGGEVVLDEGLLDLMSVDLVFSGLRADISGKRGCGLRLFWFAGFVGRQVCGLRLFHSDFRLVS